MENIIQEHNNPKNGKGILQILRIIKLKDLAKYIIDGEIYDGQRSKEIRLGKGNVYYKNGTLKYEGEFLDDKFNGNGKFILFKKRNGNQIVGIL